MAVGLASPFFLQPLVGIAPSFLACQSDWQPHLSFHSLERPGELTMSFA